MGLITDHRIFAVLPEPELSMPKPEKGVAKGERQPPMVQLAKGVSVVSLRTGKEILTRREGGRMINNAIFF